MSEGHILIHQSPQLTGTVEVAGAKNAALVIIASLILTQGKSTLTNIPNSADIRLMIALLEDLGAVVIFDHQKKQLEIDTTHLNHYEVKPEIMAKMRASILVMGPLLARFGKAKVALPGGCLIGARPIDYHLAGFRKMGVNIEENSPFLEAFLSNTFHSTSSLRISLEYPSVGATENLMLLACLRQGETIIINAAIEPEVLDLIDVLRKMGAEINLDKGLVMSIKGVSQLRPVIHAIIPDRLEAGALLLAAAISQGSIDLPNARADHMDLFLEKLKEMGHTVVTGTHALTTLPQLGIRLKATPHPTAIHFKTNIYPGFPTDLQAPLVAALCLADGVSTVEETVFENRLLHAKELQKLGAQISVEGSKATIRGVEALYGTNVIAPDIRASCALVLAGLVAQGKTHLRGIHHWQRGYDNLEHKLSLIGGKISVFDKPAHEEPKSSLSFSVESLPIIRKSP